MAGARATVGDDYEAVRLGVDTEWSAGPDGSIPYLWTALQGDDHERRFGAGGGLKLRLSSGLLAKLGAGFETARAAGSGERAGALLLEAGVERDLRAPIVGADYRLTAGRAGTSRPAGPPRARRTVRGYRSETFHDLSGFVSARAAELWLTARVGVEASDSGYGAVRQTAALTVPVAAALSGEAAITFIQGDGDGTYLSLGLLWQFR